MWKCHRSAKISCPACITIGCTADGQKLEVWQLCSDHTHTIVPEAYRHAAVNRSLDTDSRATAALMLDLGANATKVRHHLMLTTQKVVTQRDVQNIRTSNKATTYDADAVQQVVALLNQTENAVVRIVASETDGTVQSVFYQTAFMRRMFESYPETLIFDATYKVNNRNMPLFLPLVIDSAGYSQVAAVILTIDEKSETLRSALSQLSDLSDKVNDVQCLVVDKDLSAIDVLQAQFSGAVVNLCQFHCLRSFRREKTEARMRITSSQKTTVLELLTKLSYATSPEEYEQHYQQLQNLHIATVIDYYDTNWHGCKEMWVPCFKNSVANVGMSGTQRIESLHQKVKQVVKSNSDIISFYKNLLVFLTAHQSESEHRMFDAFNRFPVTDKQSVLASYSTELTEHAFSLVKQQHSASTKATIDGTTVKSHEGTFPVTTTSCQCKFYKTTSLPCRHIFRYRYNTGDPVVLMLVAAQLLYTEHSDTYINSYSLLVVDAEFTVLGNPSDILHTQPPSPVALESLSVPQTQPPSPVTLSQQPSQVALESLSVPQSQPPSPVTLSQQPSQISHRRDIQSGQRSLNAII